MVTLEYTKMECLICAEKKNSLVTCPKCSECCCKNCLQKYLCNSTMTPFCMHCREPLSDDFILDNTSLSWRTNHYKIYKEQILFDIERSRFPETQIYAEAYKNATDITRTVKNEISLLHPQLKTSLQLILAIQHFKQLKENSNLHFLSILETENPNFRQLTSRELDDLKKKTKSLRIRTNFRLQELYKTLNLYFPIVATYGKSIERTEKALELKKIFTKACPAEGCSAFLNQDFYCGICKTSVCKKCHEIIQENHACDENTVASIKALSSEAKSCPTCAALISKIDGCDQMWCTQCRTSFSWRTGLVETGITHNPHYYEWMRNNGGLPRTPGDNPGGCNQFPFIHEILNSKPDVVEKCKYSRFHAKSLSNTVINDEEHLKYLFLTKYHAQFQHIRAHNDTPIQRPDHFKLRVKLLIQEIDEKTFQIKIQRADKAYKKSVAKKNVYDMTYAAAGDILRNCVTSISFSETVDQITNLLLYSNSALERIEKGYSCTATKYKFFQENEEFRKHSYWYYQDIRRF